MNDAIEAAIAGLPEAILKRSGSVFYSGKQAFAAPNRLYVLGLNPGGVPEKRVDDTVARHIDQYLSREGSWSAYRDEPWEDRAPGTHGMQPKLLHLFRKLSIDAGNVPASNVVFVRSRSEADLYAEKAALLEACWPVHQAIIEALDVKVVLCLGGTAGAWVRSKVGANELVETFVESNRRGWKSAAYRTNGDLVVISATHPSRADWRNPAADPTPLIRKFL